jgi:hypothetical protein
MHHPNGAVKKPSPASTVEATSPASTTPGAVPDQPCSTATVGLSTAPSRRLGLVSIAFDRVGQGRARHATASRLSRSM